MSRPLAANLRVAFVPFLTIIDERDEQGPDREYARSLPLSPRHGLRYRHRQRAVSPALRPHFTSQGVSKGPQVKATRPPLTSAFDTQLTHHPLSQTLSTPIPTFIIPPTPPAETSKNGSTASEARPRDTL